jgi:cbb3-type cytochrome oxidase maturation protein
VSIAFFISFAIFLLVWLLNDKITFLLGNSEISLWLYFVPVSILMTGIYQSFNYWSNRKRQYKRLAATKIIQSSSTGVVNISLGFTETGGGGLVLGSVLGQITAASVLSGLVIKEDRSKFSQVSTEKILNLAKRYVDFFKFSNLSSILNAFSFNLFSILLSKIFSISILGFYNLIYRILTMPSVLIGRSIAQVYFEESTKQKNIYGNNRKIFISMLKKLLMLSLIIYLPMYFYIEKLIIFIFGFKWHVSGEIARILLPLMFIRFVSSVLSSTLTTYEKQKSGLIMNFLLASTVIILFLIAYMKNLGIYAFFYMYMFAMSILYGLFIIYYYHLSKGDNR